ncbi:MAG: D-2-hydroxyacid dehydrogenase [Gammaproteobacteria bacterium]|nr:D-2-hydroxyacid dehydrogenase [Gammaproteobacteria bacterium]
MTKRLQAAFLDFATLGPGVDTEPLDALADVAYYTSTPLEQTAERLEGMDVAIVNKARVDADAIEKSDQLKLIVLAATGSDNVDVKTAAQRGVGVANIRDYCTAAVVQHVFALVLCLTRKLAEYQAAIYAGAWQSSETFALFDYPIQELTGKNLGIVGYGTLGRGVAELGRCIGMNILAGARPGTPASETPDGRMPVDDVLRNADVLSLHCPLTDATRGLIGETQLERMKDDALIINTARGALIDSRALVAALKAGKIGGAGIDVMEVEPPRGDEPLLEPGIPNLILTPHIAWTARESRQRALDQVAENISDFLAGGALRRLV